MSGQAMLVPVKIASGTALSAAVDLTGGVLVGIIMPAAWTAAGMTFQVAERVDEGVTGTYQEWQTIDTINGAGAAVQINVVQGLSYSIKNPYDYVFPRFIKVRSGTSGVPVNQGADRNFWLIVRDI